MHTVRHLQMIQTTAKLQRERRRLAQNSLKTFAKLYFPDHQKSPPSKMHAELFELLQQLEPGGKLAVAGPRGSAKSTVVSLFYVLWYICYRKCRYLVLISDTQDKASDFLSHIKDELTDNERLRSDFPEVCETIGSSPGPPRWSRHEIITANGVKVTAMGYGQNIRGKRHRQDRPELILLDDVESRENTATSEARKKLEEWFNKSVLKAGTVQTRVVVVGTLQHYDALLAKLTDSVKNPFWTSRIYRSVIAWSDNPDLWQKWSAILHGNDEYEQQSGRIAADLFFEAYRKQMLEGTHVLWPERESYYALMLMRESEGRASFDSEKQNEPVNPQDCLFLEEEFQFWDDHWENEQALIKSVGEHGQFIGACDPSMGKAGINADDSAIITLLLDRKTRHLYVLDADIKRRKPDRIIDDVIAYGRIRKYACFGFEANQFQSFVADELRRRAKEANVNFPVLDIHHTSDKIGRIQRLQPLITSGLLKFSRRQQALLDQLRFFPKAAHDDGPDALEMAYETCYSVPAPNRGLKMVMFRPSRYP